MQKTIWDKYAQVLVDYSVDVQKGDLVMISATSFEARDLVKAVYKRVIEKGGNAIVKVSLGDLSEIFLKNPNFFFFFDYIQLFLAFFHKALIFFNFIDIIIYNYE